MRFLVLGASGMAGHVISIYLSEQGHDVVGLCRRPVSFVPCIQGDVTDSDLLQECLWDSDFDAVINAVGILNQFAEQNPEKAAYINGAFPHHLAKMTQNLSTMVIHMSTDCVFAGNTGPYTELSTPDGASVYDKTKAQGELNDDKNMTLRNSIIGPDINEAGIGLFNWFMKQDGPINGFTKAMWTGLTTLELAKAMEYVAENRCTGLVNMVPDDNISKYDLLSLFNRYFKSGKIKISPSDELILDKTLVRTNFDCGFVPKSYEEQIAEMAEWVYRHAKLYPHYELR